VWRGFRGGGRRGGGEWVDEGRIRAEHGGGVRDGGRAGRKIEVC